MIDSLRDSIPVCQNWTPREWAGNPELNLEAIVKTFKNPINGHKVQVWVFGKPNKYNFCVAAGTYSEYSYSGSFYPVNSVTIEEYCAIVDSRYTQGKLFK